MLNKSILDIKRQLKNTANFDETIDCTVVFEGLHKKILVGTTFFKTSQVVKYLIGTQKVTGYETVQPDQLLKKNYKDEKCEFYAKKDDFAIIMKKFGITLYNMNHKLQLFDGAKSGSITLALNQNALSFKVCKFSQIEKLVKLIEYALNDLRVSGIPIKKMYLKTTMGPIHRLL